MPQWRVPAAIIVGAVLVAVAMLVQAKPAESVRADPSLWLPLPGANNGTWFMDEADTRFTSAGLRKRPR